MALPNGAGGYQVGDGNINDPIIDLIPEPAAVAGTAILTVPQILGGYILANSGLTTTQTYTLPSVADLEAVLVNSDRIGTSFMFRLTNLGTSTATAIIAAGTGWTITGSLTMTIPINTGAVLLARKSAVGAWNLYRI